MFSRIVVIAAVLIHFATFSCGFAATKIVRPKVNHQVEPIGIENDAPVFRWNLEDDVRGTMQEQYRICVASEPGRLATDPDLWDTGWVESANCIEIPYRGKPLDPSRKYFWTVRVINNRDETSELDRPASFVTGLFSESDWKGRWISMDRTDKAPLPIFRKSFSLGKNIKTAYVHICGLGHYELRLNGNKVGQSFIDPGWTNYRKTCLYSSYDVTETLQKGENVFGVLLGNGMYNVPGGRYVKFTGSFGLPKLIAQLEITYDDGSRETVATDTSWKCDFGPITFSCVYGGEDFDATRLQSGWDKAGFDDTRWTPAVVLDGPGGVLRAQEAPPIIVAETLTPTSLHRLENGQYIADFGYNFSGRPRIVLNGPAGSQVTVKTGELVDRIWEGHSYTYTLKGSGRDLPLERADDLENAEMELILPKFSYFGFQFLRIEGAVTEKDRKPEDADKPTLVAVYADFTTSAAERVGTFRCSNEMVNEIDAMIERSVRSNLQSVLTDCPHREKLGWLEVAHLMGPSIMSRFDVQNLYRKICRDISEAQLENGHVPDIAPEYTRFSAGFFESPEWGSASVLLPWQLANIYGDKEIFSRQEETMRRYVDYLASIRNEQGLVKAGLGDWYDWSPEKGHAGYSQHTPGELTATAMLYLNASIYSKLASSARDRNKYAALADQVKADYIKAYANPDGTIAQDSQAAYAFSIPLQLLDDSQTAADFLLKRLEKDNYAPTTGEVSFRYLLEALSSMGQDEIIWKIITRTEKPGYGYMLKHCGMKTLSETWDGPGSSMNHCMFGHAQEWFTQGVLGIRFAKSTDLLWESVKPCDYTIAPNPVGDLEFAEGYWDSPYGRVESSWKRDGDRIRYRIVIPANMKCAVFLPTSSGVNRTTLDRVPLDQFDLTYQDILSEDAETRNVIFLQLGSGSYEFETDLKP